MSVSPTTRRVAELVLTGATQLAIKAELCIHHTTILRHRELARDAGLLPDGSAAQGSSESGGAATMHRLMMEHGSAMLRDTANAVLAKRPIRGTPTTARELREMLGAPV